MVKPVFNRKSITILEPSTFMGLIKSAAVYNFRFSWKDTVIITEQSDNSLRLMNADELRVVELRYVRLHSQIVFFIQNGWFVIELSFSKSKDNCSAYVLFADTEGNFFEIEESHKADFDESHLLVSNNFLKRLTNPASSRIPKKKEEIMAAEHNDTPINIDEGVLEHIDSSVIQKVDVSSTRQPVIDDDTQSVLVLDASMQLFDDEQSWTFVWEPSTRTDKLIASASGNIAVLLSDFKEHQDHYLKMEGLLLNLLDRNFVIKQLMIAKSKEQSVVILKYETPKHRNHELRYIVNRDDFALIPKEFTYDLEKLPLRQG